MKNDSTLNVSSREVDHFTSLLEWANFYARLGLSLFPTVLGTKKPAVPWKRYQEVRSPSELIETWFSKLVGIAVVCGAVSGGLFIQDFERRKDAEEFYPKFDELCATTLVAETPHLGIHVFVQTLDPPRRTIRLCEEHPLDILGSGGYAVVPPSTVDGKRYRFLGSAKQILWLEQDPLAAILNRGRELGWKMRVPAASQSATSDPVAITPSRTLTDKQRQAIVEALVPYWQHGQRHELTVYLLGFLIKRDVIEEDSQAIIRGICQAAGDEELTGRLAQVSYHYRSRIQLGSKLRGISGLRELLGVQEN